MDKIRNILKPGGKHEDDVMYGTPDSSTVRNQQDTGANLQTDSGVDKTSDKLSRQVIDPGREKQDETRHGTTAHADGPFNVATSGAKDHQNTNASQLEPLPASGDARGFSHQVLNPGGGETDSTPYAETGRALPGSEPGALRNTTGANEDLARPVGTNQPHQNPADMTYTKRSFPLGGGTTSSQPTQSLSGGGPTTASTGTPSNIREAARQETGLGMPGQTTQTSSSEPSHFSRDAAIAGGVGAGAVGAGELAGLERKQQPQDDISRAMYTDRPYQTGGVGPGGHHEDERPVDGYIHHTSGPHATDTANKLDPHVPGEFPTETGEDVHHHHGLGTDAAIGTAGAAGIGAAGYEADTFGNQPVAASVPQPAQSTESPASVPPYAKGQGHPTSTTNNARQTGSATARGTERSEQQHHYGRDTTMVGGAGAAGVGAYELAKDRGDDIQTSQSTSKGLAPQPQFSTLNQSTTTGPYQSDSLNRVDPLIQSDPAKVQERDEPHYGRDAAIVGGAGATRGVAYEQVKDRNNTGKVSNTLGPRDSNVVNVTDPRIQSQPSRMEESTMTDPYKSDTMNKMDPRVKSETSKVEEKDQPRYGRDAALAGGAGVAGAGAYEASKHHDKEVAAAAQQPGIDQGAAATQTQQAQGSHHEHNKLHKRNDPRGHQEEKHDRDLQKAREEEAVKGGGHHDKKPGLLSRILHPNKDKHDRHAEEDLSKDPQYAQHQEQPAWITKQMPPDIGGTQEGPVVGELGRYAPPKRHGEGVANPSTGMREGNDGTVIEPHTGLPMNVEKYGTTGAGGTDGAKQIEGYHETDPTLRSTPLGTAEGPGKDKV